MTRAGRAGPGVVLVAAGIGAALAAGCGAGPDDLGPDGGVDAGVGALGPTRYPHLDLASPVTAAVAARARAIAAAGPGQRDDVFMKVGASGTVSTRFLYCLAGPEHQPGYLIDLDGRDHLQATLDRFRAGTIDGDTPFDRATLAAKVGQTARWAVTGAPSPLEQELAATTPRYAFINYGTNDMGAAASYGAALVPFWQYMNQLLDQVEGAGVVPIVTGLNPRADSAAAARWVPTWDAVTRALAEARQVPYLSLYRAMVDLPDQGLSSDGIHGTTYVLAGRAEPCVFTPDGLRFNYDLRNLMSLDALDRVRAVVEGAPAGEAEPRPPVAGIGSDADPFVIDALPFSHTWDTARGARVRDGYPACDTGQDESGPEIVYRLELTRATPIRIVVLDRGAVDADAHLVSGGACVERDDRLIDRIVPPGDHRIVIDTFVSGGVERAGAYTLVVLACEPGDPDC